MDEIAERVRAQIAFEFGRAGPPDCFPQFPDIPKRRYSDPDFYRLERDELWPNTWMYVGNAHDLEQRGSYILWAKGGIPIIIVRGKDGIIRAFYNSCRHRGAPLVREESGRASLLRCQYHSWTYDLEGKLVAVPDKRDFIDLDITDRCLIELRCESWGSWIFVNQNRECEPLASSLGSLVEEFEQFDSANLRVVETRSHIIPCNWKIVVEAFLEVYHFPHIHKPRENWGLGAFDIDPAGVAIELMPNGHSRMVTPFTKSALKLRGMENALDWKREHDPDTGFPDIPTVNAMVRSTSTAYNVFPNIMIPVDATGFPIQVVWPIDMNTSRLDLVHMAPDWGDGPFPAQWQPRMDGFDRIILEDKENLGPIQQCLAIPDAPGVPLSYQERRIWQLHETIDQVIGRDKISAELQVPDVLGPFIFNQGGRVSA